MTTRKKVSAKKSGKAQAGDIYDFTGQSLLEAFNPFLTDSENRHAFVFAWAQFFLLPLHGKALEKACSDLMQYILHQANHFKGNIVQDSIYWAGKKNPGHNNLNYALKEWLMSVIVYNDCPQIRFDESGTPVWDFADKSPRFLQRDEQYNKTDPEKIIKASGFTIAQKTTIFSGIVAGFLDTPEIVRTVKKKKSKVEEHSE
jgi:hypothetical protein